MPTVIDSLVITIGLDPAKYRKGRVEVTADFKKVREEASSTAKEVEAKGAQAAEFFSKMKREALSFFTIIAGGSSLKNFVEGQVTAAAATGRMAENLGVATEDLSRWQQVMVRAGGTAEDANGLFEGLARTLSDLQLGQNPENVGVLQKLRITPEDLKDTNGAILKIAEGLRQVRDTEGAAVATNLGERLGFSAAAINELSKGSANAREQLARSAPLTREQAEAARAAQAAFAQLGQTMASTGRQILTSLTPYALGAVKVLESMAQWAAKNPGIIRAAFLGIAAAALVMNAALLPEIALFAAIAAGIAAVSAGIGWLIDDFNKFKDGTSRLDWSGLTEAIHNVGAAFADLGGAVKEVLDRFAPGLWDDIGSSVTRLANGAIKLLVDSLNGVAITMRTIANLARGQDFNTAASNAVNTVNQENATVATRPSAPAPARPTATPPAANAPPAARPATPQAIRAPNVPPAANATDQALSLIRQREGFRATAYWDVNAFRAGYGSDTVTDPASGRVSRVTRTTQVTREQAEADIKRRVTQEFMPAAQRAVGQAWEGLNNATKAALTSVAYNYGNLPRAVTAAARTGDTNAIATAIEALKGDNRGVNQDRRLAEAALVRNSGIIARLPPAGAGAVASGNIANDNSRTTTVQTNIAAVNIQTQATDAAGIARAIPSALEAYPFVAQANTGMR